MNEWSNDHANKDPFRNGTMNGIQNDLPITICADPTDAIAQGYVYCPPDYLPARLEKAVVVHNGTVEGRSTVDLLFTDESGQKHVVMLTGRLIQMLAEVTR